jgi:hypothetical protein
MCLLSGLAFKLTFHPDGTVSYLPDVDPERDAILVELLPAEFQKYMRYMACLSASYERRV